MCGIAGKLNFDSKRPVSFELIKSMTSILKHRGPDDEGIYVKENIGLGNRRLSIIDLTSAGHQPMTNEDKTLWITYNGEIYNFLELRKDLIKKGHKFHSRSDTEVILHLYEEKGENCLKYLRGMFALALWDGKEKKLFLVRDGLGQKPLYYFFNNRCLIFGSEIKAILADGEVKKEINPKALYYYLAYHYIPSPLTIFYNILKLPPGHFLICQKGKIKIKRYWQLDYNRKLDLSENDCLQELRTRLEEAVKIRMISDVPLGAFLSGGIDSSIVVALMSKFSQKPVKTFSIGFEDAFYNELPYAKLIAKRYKTDHHEFIVKPSVVEILPKLVWHYGEPFADSSALVTFLVARETKNFVKVALNGDGGDENFAGYRRYYFNKLLNWYSKIPPPIRRKIIDKLVKSIPYTKSVNFNNLLKRLKVYLEISSRPQPERHFWLLYWFNFGLEDYLYSEGFKKMIKKENFLDPMITAYKNFGNFKNSLDNLLSVEVNTYLPDDLLVKMDVACMANSLEPRSPLLDHQFMEFVASLPPNFKIKRGERKYIFKKALKDLLPKEILARGKKGFMVPIDQWFREELKDYIFEILLDSKTITRGYFKREGIEKLLNEHCHQKINHGHIIWALIILEIWHRIFIDGK